MPLNCHYQNVICQLAAGINVIVELPLQNFNFPIFIVIKMAIVELSLSNYRYQIVFIQLSLIQMSLMNPHKH
jgi:hypothetical protein